jgi:pyridoxal phosphate enzyme (YggS family)
MAIADNLQRVRERIARAAESAGRATDSVRLVGVTKYVGPREALELAEAGCRDLGESRPQQLWEKAESFERIAEGSDTALRIRWHLVGHLQRNKVRRTLPLVTMIHSVDSERLLSAINDNQPEFAGGDAPLSDVLLEVNTSGEPAKHGLAPGAVEPLIASAPNYPHVRIRGLMTMAALTGGQAVAAQNFASLRKLRDQLQAKAPDCVDLQELSMGMSVDFEVAIREGATIVRVGSALWD